MVLGLVILRLVRVVCQRLFLSSSLPLFLSSLFLSPSHQFASSLPYLLCLPPALSLFYSLFYPLPASPLRFCGALTCARAPNADVTGAAVESIQMLELTHALAALEGGDEQFRVGAGGGDGKGAREGQATCLFRLICSSQVSSSFCAPVPRAHPSSVYLP